jgi:hypothetical protein
VKRTVIAVAALVAGSVNVAQAQIIQPTFRSRPIAWTSLMVGWMQQTSFCDPDSDACWNFGSAPQFRGALEMPIGRSGASAGIVATTARVPLVYAGGVLGPNTCNNCDADANVTQFLGNFRLGGGAGFHQVIDLVAGSTMFHNFRATDGTRLGTGKAVHDITFGLGYGFGYGITSRTQFILVQEWTIIIHKRESGNPNNTAQQQTIRIGPLTV